MTTNKSIGVSGNGEGSQEQPQRAGIADTGFQQGVAPWPIPGGRPDVPVPDMQRQGILELREPEGVQWFKFVQRQCLHWPGQ